MYLNKTKSVKNIAKIKNLTNSLKQKIFGQDEAINIIVDYITISAAGLNDKEKPIGSFLFTGPTGVGKTELAKQLAYELGIHFQRFDMSEYSTERSADNLIGGAAGLVGYDEGGLLTNAILENSNCVLLLDEIEKADPSVLNKFLQVMDYGKLTSSKGKEVYFKNTIVIFTSNLGAIKTEKRTAGFGAITYIETENSFDEYLTPEFIGRINQIIEFNPLDEFTLNMIVRKYFTQIEELLFDRNISIEPRDILIEKIIGQSDEKFGARNLENLINQNIKLIIAQELISGNLKDYSKIIFDWDEDINSLKYVIKEKDLLINAPNLHESTHFFANAENAQEYARQNIGVIITRDPYGNGYIVKVDI